MLITVSTVNECHYCAAAHATIAQIQKVPADVVAANRVKGNIVLLPWAA